MDLMNRVQQLEKQVARLEENLKTVTEISRDVVSLTKQDWLFTYLSALWDLLSFVAVRTLNPEQLKEFLERLKDIPAAGIPKELREFLDKLQGDMGEA